jgi:hypothetical protein
VAAVVVAVPVVGSDQAHHVVQASLRVDRASQVAGVAVVAADGHAVNLRPDRNSVPGLTRDIHLNRICGTLPSR